MSSRSESLLHEHAAGCPACDADPVQGSGLVSLIDGLVPASSARSAQDILTGLRPALTTLERRASFERMAASVALALLPLPVLAGYGLWFVGKLSEFARLLLPSQLASYVALSYAVTLVLLYALTYASVPLLVERLGRRRTLVGGIAT